MSKKTNHFQNDFCDLVQWKFGSMMYFVYSILCNKWNKAHNQLMSSRVLFVSMSLYPFLNSISIPLFFFFTVKLIHMFNIKPFHLYNLPSCLHDVAWQLSPSPGSSILIENCSFFTIWLNVLRWMCRVGDFLLFIDIHDYVSSA